MVTREIVLDTETTGLDPRQGHRIIEVACVEVVDQLPTGRSFHRFVDPGRAVDPDAERVHGISSQFLQGKPRFGDPTVVDELLDFVGESQLVAHNAAFDRDFLNNELRLVGRPPLDQERWVDTLALAQQRYPGMYNSLDALCKRFRVSLADRTRHGARVDAQLLAKVYVELRGGRERSLNLGSEPGRPVSEIVVKRDFGPRPRPIGSRLSEAERVAHEAFVSRELGASALWLRPAF